MEIPVVCKCNRALVFGRLKTSAPLSPGGDASFGYVGDDGRPRRILLEVEVWRDRLAFVVPKVKLSALRKMSAFTEGRWLLDA